MTKIIPAILTNNPLDLQRKIKRIKGLTDLVQIDIMDGRFVKNQSIEIDLLKLYKNFNFELHLMVECPQDYLQKISKKQIESFVFHFESKANIKRLINKIKQRDIKVGLAINPDTKVKEIDPFLGSIDFVLVLGVNPGFAGSKFQNKALEKVRYLKSQGIKVEVDGGINLDNIKKIKKAGADRLAIGTGLFNSKDIKTRFNKLKNKVN